MGRIKQGILGGFSGKVGTVIGGSWKGISYMRGIPLSVKDARTPAQISQRTKFGLTANYLQPLTPLIRAGWKLYADGKSAGNAATAYTLANAITGAYPDYAIDHAKILVSRGALAPAAGATAVAVDDVLEIAWTDNSGAGAAKQTDRALIAIVNPAKGEAITTDEGAERSTGTQTIAVPAEWAGDTLHAYIGFISEDGKEVANSVYLGSI